MKKYIIHFLSFLILLAACSRPVSDQSGIVKTPTWQEKYDLGIRYLSEGNYEEAIIAFTAAIGIDPKQASAYVGRGQAYVLSGETEKNLNAAQTDFEMATELDETLVDAWLGLADVYIRNGDYDKALEVLQQGLEKTGNSEKIAAKISEIEGTTSSDYSRFISDDLISDQEFTIGGIPFYELSLQSAIDLLPTSDIQNGIQQLKDAEGNVSVERYNVYRSGVGGIIHCEQLTSSSTLTSLAYSDYYNNVITGVLTEVRGIKTGDSIETVLERIGIIKEGASILAQTEMSITIGANHGIRGGYGWIETDETMVSVNGTQAKMINILMDNCNCQMDFVEGILVNLNVSRR